MDSLANDMITYKMPTQSLKAGLIDGLLYSDEVEKTLKNRLSVAEDDDLNLVSLQDYYNIEISGSTVQKSAPHVAILYLEGEIDNGNQDGISSSKTMKEIEKLRKDENVKSVVVRVNSPGGSAYGAEQIWHAIEELKKSKPVTVSMGNYAASGGYYLSAGANRIFANNNTITGSIGVFSVIPNLEGLMNKLGVKTQVVKTNPYADLLGNVARPLDEHEKEVLQEHVGEVYDMFLTRCSKGRSMPKPDVEKVAEGRVWVGQDAHSISLVDEIGTLDDAVKYAAKTANLPVDCPVVGYPEKKDFFSQLTELPHIGYDRIFKGSVLTKERKVFDKLSNMDYVQAAMPFSIELK